MDSRILGEEEDTMSIMKEVCRSASGRAAIAMIESLQQQFEQVSYGCASSSFSVGEFSSEGLSLSFGLSEHGHPDDASSSTGGSSPLAWFPPRRYGQILSNSSNPTHEIALPIWSDKCDKELTELEMMKEKYAKLLLGEDMSGGGKGVSSALAISNAITNLSASVFGEIWRLEPLPPKCKAMWRREIEWLVSITDHIVELVPTLQAFPDGSSFEVMISRPRIDIQLNLPALRKLDAMLLECMDSFLQAEFWYVDQGFADDDFENGPPRPSLQRNEEKWWLPIIKVPVSGLSDGERKRLQNQRECINQILKAALAINSQVLSEMEVPDVYRKALPKNGKVSLGEAIYKILTSDSFSVESFLSACDLSSEHKILEIVNRTEAVIHVWRRSRQPRSRFKATRDSWKNAKSSWGMVKEFISDTERRDFFAERAEEALICLKQKFPGLRQSLLDISKIQFNKDVGQSILESYSRVMESLASSILARIDDIIFVDDMTKCSLPLSLPPVQTGNTLSQKQVYSMSHSIHQNLYGTSLKTPSVSLVPSPGQRQAPNSPLNSEQKQVLSEYANRSCESDCTRNNFGGHAFKKISTGQHTKSVNSGRLQSVHPVQDE